MWLFYCYDGKVLATSSECRVGYIEETYDVQTTTYTDDVEYALEKCDYVIE